MKNLGVKRLSLFLFDGLGLRRAVDISLPAFVSSVHAPSSLVDALTFRVNRLAATTELVETGHCRTTSVVELNAQQ